MDQVKFIHLRLFDKSAMVKHFPYNGISCWGVRASDAKHFIGEFLKYKPVEVRPKEGDAVLAINYKLMDDYVCSRIDTYPPTELFDVTKHLAVVHLSHSYCWCGCGAFDEIVTSVEYPYQVIIVPSVMDFFKPSNL